ncbi:MAG: cell division protein SepF [Candidatus Altiarchaeota archaeon]|nr:cell division protein SepF [Candidatus Altiarchaeota archaeon]
MVLGNLLKSGRKKEEHVVEARVSKDIQPRLKMGLMVMERHADLEKILSKFRKGDIVLLVKISPLREKDMNELKKAVERLKTHCSVTGSDLAALDDNWIVLVPPVVEIAR